MCIGTMLLWLPDLDLPFGNSDDGRIFARAGIQARNFWELGPIESGIGTRLDPFIRAEFDVPPRTDPPRAAVTYAHHPPLKQFLTIASVGVFGDSLPAVRLTDFLLGAATVAFMAAVLRTVGFGWGPTLVALAVFVSTGFFYVYARMGISFSMLLALTAAIARLRKTPDPPRWACWCTGALAALTAMHSWIALASLGLLLPWLFIGSYRRRTSADSLVRTDAPAAHRGERIVRLGSARWLRRGWSAAMTSVAVGAGVGALVTAGWLLNGTDVGEIAERVAFRTGNQVSTAADQAHFGFGEFLARQWRFASHELLTSWWLRLAIVPALVAGLVDRRSRGPVVVTLAVAAALTFALQQGAWIHRLWNFPWLAPVTIGSAALADAVRRALRGQMSRLCWPLGLLVGIVSLVTLVAVVRGPTRDFYLTAPADAGAVLEAALADAPQTAEAELAWFTSGISTPRWMSYYLDLPVWPLTEEQLGQVEPADLILVRNDRAPGFLGDALERNPLAAGEFFTLLRAGDVPLGESKP